MNLCARPAGMGTGGTLPPRVCGPRRFIEALERRTLLSSAAIPRPDHVVVVVEEDHSYNQILGTTVPQPVMPGVPIAVLNGAPYSRQLAAGGASLTQMHSIGHPNHVTYSALFAGLNTAGLAQPYDAPNLASDLNAAGLSFGGYAESLPHAGYLGDDVGNYKRDHVPWVTFSNVPSSEDMPFSRFPADFAKLPTVSFVIPNLQNNMHSGLMSTADQWLRDNISDYARWAMSHNSLLIVTWDESHETGNQIPTIFYGPMIEPGKVGARVNQFNLLRTIEDMYALAPTGKAAQATPIKEVFGSGGLVEPFEKAVLRARPHSRGDHVSLSGRVLDAGGKGLSGWWVYLDANHSGDLEPGDPIVPTRRGGHFSFRGLVAGTYDVRVVPQAQYVPPSPAGGALRLTIGAQEHVTGIQFSERQILSNEASGTAAARP